MTTICGYVENIVYRNEDNGYTVFNIETDDGETTCVGSFNFINEGELLELKGEFVDHNVYGNQFKVIEHMEKQPEDEESIERYLGSGAIKGIGIKLAARIVAKFGKNTFNIIDNEPERLSEVKGISERKARELAEQIENKRSLRKVMIYLQELGITTNLAVKIYEHYGSKVYKVIEENPYQLADTIEGVGFRTADEIASRSGILADSDFRIHSGIFYTLNQSVQEGHVYLPEDVLINKSSQLLGVELDNIEKYIMDLCMEHKIVIKEEDNIKKIYPATYYYMELNSARMLDDLNIHCSVSEDTIEKHLRNIEESENLVLDKMQHKAVVESIKHGICIITGGPGTGKTTTINTMIKFFISENMDVLLAAPTGRAAKRMTEATGYEAQTIHRLLEVSGNPKTEGSVNGFMRNRQNPLECDAIIIDEMSMVDISLMHALLSAITPGTRLILVGDVNQLPSVGPGSVLKDIIASEKFSVVTLTRIFRQAGESDIVVNAHKINNGEQVDLYKKSNDFFFLKRDTADEIIGVIVLLMTKNLPRFLKIKPTDIQVLTPTRKGLLGVERLNEVLQHYLNPPADNKAEKVFGNKKFRVGDKVMQTKNNYQLEWQVQTKYGISVDSGLGIFNGDMGIVSKVDNYRNIVEVEYDEHKKVIYTNEVLDELELAYAITVHKAQGSEYPAVLMPILNGPKLLFNRNLLYTGVTRAKRCFTVIGSDYTFQEMIQNKNEQNRYTGLDLRIQEF